MKYNLIIAILYVFAIALCKSQAPHMGFMSEQVANQTNLSGMGPCQVPYAFRTAVATGNVVTIDPIRQQYFVLSSDSDIGNAYFQYNETTTGYTCVYYPSCDYSSIYGHSLLGIESALDGSNFVASSTESSGWGFQIDNIPNDDCDTQTNIYTGNSNHLFQQMTFDAVNNILYVIFQDSDSETIMIGIDGVDGTILDKYNWENTTKTVGFKYDYLTKRVGYCRERNDTTYSIEFYNTVTHVIEPPFYFTSRPENIPISFAIDFDNGTMYVVFRESITNETSTLYVMTEVETHIEQYDFTPNVVFYSMVYTGIPPFGSDDDMGSILERRRFLRKDLHKRKNIRTKYGGKSHFKNKIQKIKF